MTMHEFSKVGEKDCRRLQLSIFWPMYLSTHTCLAITTQQKSQAKPSCV